MENILPGPRHSYLLENIGSVSIEKKVTNGVPQCSVPGRSVFDLSINDLPQLTAVRTDKYVFHPEKCKVVGMEISKVNHKV